MTALKYKFAKERLGKSRHALWLVGFEEGDDGRVRIECGDDFDIHIGSLGARADGGVCTIDTSELADGIYTPRFIKDNKIYTSAALIAEGGRLTPILSLKEAAELTERIFVLQQRLDELVALCEELKSQIGKKETFTLK